MPRLKTESDEQYKFRISNNSGDRPYKVYTALFKYTGEVLNPVVLETTFKSSIVWVYDSPGVYLIQMQTLDDIFIENKTATLCTIGNISLHDSDVIYYSFMSRISNTEVRLNIYDIKSNALANYESDYPMMVEIRVYK